MQSTNENESLPRDDGVVVEAGDRHSSVDEMTVSRLSVSSFGLSGCLSLVALCVLVASEEVVQQVCTYAPLIVFANYVLVNVYLKLKFQQGYHYQVHKYIIFCINYSNY